MINEVKKYDLEERTAVFGEKSLLFCKNIPRSITNDIITKQLARSATSIGANYMEANGCDSRKDFRNKIGICRKESKETMHWLRMFAVLLPKLKPAIHVLWKEAHELSLIFGAIANKL